MQQLLASLLCLVNKVLCSEVTAFEFHIFILNIYIVTPQGIFKRTSEIFNTWNVEDKA